MKKDFIISNKIDTNDYTKALELIKKSRYILVVTHINPDADTISCALALSNLFYENKIKHKIFNVGKNLPINLNFIPKFEKITNVLPKFYDLVICLDCANYERLGIEVEKNIPIINIDHHKSNKSFGTINMVDPYKASASELVFNFFKYNGLYISKSSAIALYVGIYDDTLAFSSSRCDELTFEKINFLVKCGADPAYISSKMLKRDSLAKYRIIPKILKSLELYKEGEVASIVAMPDWFKETGANNMDCEDAINMIMKMAIVKLAIFVRISNNQSRISFRSKGNIDVSKIAEKFGGGGHLNSAGCTLNIKDVQQAKKIILKDILEYGN